MPANLRWREATAASVPRDPRISRVAPLQRGSLVEAFSQLCMGDWLYLAEVGAEHQLNVGGARMPSLAFYGWAGNLQPAGGPRPRFEVSQCRAAAQRGSQDDPGSGPGVGVLPEAGFQDGYTQGLTSGARADSAESVWRNARTGAPQG